MSWHWDKCHSSDDFSTKWSACNSSEQIILAEKKQKTEIWPYLLKLFQGPENSKKNFQFNLLNFAFFIFSSCKQRLCFLAFYNSCCNPRMNDNDILNSEDLIADEWLKVAAYSNMGALKSNRFSPKSKNEWNIGLTFISWPLDWNRTWGKLQRKRG